MIKFLTKEYAGSIRVDLDIEYKCATPPSDGASSKNAAYSYCRW
jgi:hypothetical protein